MILTPIRGISVETNEDMEIILVAKNVFVKVRGIDFFFTPLSKYRQSGVNYFSEESLLGGNGVCEAHVLSFEIPVSTADNTNHSGNSPRSLLFAAINKHSYTQNVTFPKFLW